MKFKILNLYQVLDILLKNLLNLLLLCLSLKNWSILKKLLLIAKQYRLNKIRRSLWIGMIQWRLGNLLPKPNLIGFKKRKMKRRKKNNSKQQRHKKKKEERKIQRKQQKNNRRNNNNKRSLNQNKVNKRI